MAPARWLVLSSCLAACATAKAVDDWSTPKGRVWPLPAAVWEVPARPRVVSPPSPRGRNCYLAPHLRQVSWPPRVSTSDFFYESCFLLLLALTWAWEDTAACKSSPRSTEALVPGSLAATHGLGSLGLRVETPASGMEVHPTSRLLPSRCRGSALGLGPASSRSCPRKGKWAQLSPEKEALPPTPGSCGAGCKSS